ncbi:MAG: DUF3613 domain-containing protein [Pseudomonas sp.]|jgi:hypothetical protein|uniref:DUF3613 domain-containing protein n=1 Tax=unclassified Pseudomonas TaxID=196821 RepID=UPI000272C11E|nr:MULTISPECIES: DUF3613 domain-containing protein [unclassified Pseudomonas]MDP9032140.1 DUF3613 domain-containing protein [Pseudomonadota bacterium]AUO21057.1 DUF3613 domain-containing protein [Pseudomonas sp. NC02]EJF67912.1 hypothetical protein A462_29814 [Pseudomonas sp. Ag1]MDE1912950.1 DUF3613 domain-containing protein [Pseudomonas sp.]MDE2031551.1 DUF3613 domain-containing protein [Pseudomonas sp.]
MKFTLLATLLFASLPLTVLAIEPGPSSPQQKQTEGWLQLQVSGERASPIRQKATPAERDQAMQRLLDSYKHPIPEYYDQKLGGNTPGSNN